MQPLEPVTAEPIRRVPAPVFIQGWAPTVFLHWPTDLETSTACCRWVVSPAPSTA